MVKYINLFTFNNERFYVDINEYIEAFYTDQEYTVYDNNKNPLKTLASTEDLSEKIELSNIIGEINSTKFQLENAENDKEEYSSLLKLKHYVELFEILHNYYHTTSIDNIVSNKVNQFIKNKNDSDVFMKNIIKIKQQNDIGF